MKTREFKCGDTILKLAEADSFYSRLKGFMGKKEIEPGTGILFRNCSSIHSCFMKIPIDVLYFDEDMVLIYKETIEPWKIGTQFIKDAKHVVELAEHAADYINIGSRLREI